MTSEPRSYGYQRFTPAEYDFTEDLGLKAGDTYRDVPLRTLSGEEVRLSDYLQDKPLVLETGSMTCPMYAQSVPPMRTLAETYPELDFVLLYVREAHPGELQPQHRTQDAKIEAACKTRRRYRETRDILVDDVEGSAHRFYGSMPNSIYVIAPDGEILFRSIWNNALEMEAILGDVARGQPVASRELKAVPPFSLRAVRTLLMGGAVALWDFARGLPRLVSNHKKVGNM
jgi:hypothetical protein